MSAKKFKIVVSDKVEVSVKGSFMDEDGKPAAFKFSLVCKRLGAEKMKAAMSGGDLYAQEFLADVTTGWKGQRLVLNEDDSPAEFGPESLEALLDISGMAGLCFNAYMKESAAKEKN